MVGRELGQVARDHRQCVDVGATVTRADGTDLAVWITDMSLGGCRVEWKETLWIGERLLLQVPGFAPMPSQVKWSFLGTAGLQFTDHEGFPPPSA